MVETCECSDEFGPCEQHSEVMAQREGSSSRSADELCVVYLEDAQGLVPDCLSPYGVDVRNRASEALEALGPFSSWIEDEGLADELRDVVRQVEDNICHYFWTVWDDGYRILKVSDDCPLLNN